MASTRIIIDALSHEIERKDNIIDALNRQVAALSEGLADWERELLAPSLAEECDCLHPERHR